MHNYRGLEFWRMIHFYYGVDKNAWLVLPYKWHMLRRMLVSALRDRRSQMRKLSIFRDLTPNQMLKVMYDARNYKWSATSSNHFPTTNVLFAKKKEYKKYYYFHYIAEKLGLSINIKKKKSCSRHDLKENLSRPVSIFSAKHW